MTSGGPKPPKLTRYTSETYVSIVLRRDPNYARESQEDVEYEMSSPKAGVRIFKGFYKSRGPYAP